MESEKRGYKTADAVTGYIDERMHFGWEIRGQRVVKFGGIKSGDDVLDLCCGAGMVSKTVRETIGPSGKIVGIDTSCDFIKYAKQFCNYKNCSFLVGDVENLDVILDKQKFDVAMLLASWFWIKDKDGLYRQIGKHLNEKGKFVLSLSSDNLEDETTTRFYWIFRKNLKKQVLTASPGTDLSYFDKLPVVDRGFVDKVIKQVEDCGLHLLSENEGRRDLDFDGKLYTYKTPARTEWVGDFAPDVRYEIIKNALMDTKEETGDSIIIKKHTYYLTFKA
jgi:ubiquinone/menaquinone biosynthesis C-methylase UbiE